MRRRPTAGVGAALILAGAALGAGAVLLSLSWAAGRAFLSRPKVALLTIEGTIFDSRPVVEVLERYRRDRSIKALVVRVDSPGGAVGPAQEIYQALRDFRAEGRPVVASLGSVAASGGYYVALGAEKIYANPGTITGSIGVVILLSNFEELMKKVGVGVTVLKTGALKDAGSPLRRLTEADRRVLQGLIDDAYEQFVRAVMRGRRMSRERVRRVADGRVLSGERAKGEGLVDELGNLQEAVAAAAALAHIPGRPTVVEERPELGLLGRLIRLMLPGEVLRWGGTLRVPAVRLQYMWQY
ncbi:MAG: signal peptide peptidase SppA [Nitrospinota bacterium]